MTRACTLVAVALAIIPTAAVAHAFGARYELPVPVWLFIAGGASAVTLTFVVLAAFARAVAERYAQRHWTFDGTSLGSLLSGRWVIATAKSLGVAGLLLVVCTGLFGTADPNRNLAPALVWIVWWVGFTYAAMLIGNVWPAVNPWHSLHDLVAARRARPPRAPAPWPTRIGSWPAVAALLVFGWVELVFPFRAAPTVLATLVIVYSVFTWAGMTRYGPRAWLEHADPFHRVFELYSRFAPIANTPREGLVVRPYAAGLMANGTGASPTAEVVFLMGMLALVLFDGLQGSKHWTALEDAVHAIDPTLGSAWWIGLHTAGLVATWLLFLGLYLAACALASVLTAGVPSTLDYARAFAPTLIPIAVGYHFAHSFTYLLVQGQSIVFLVSDPFGLGWNLFGTRDATIDIAIIGTRTAWYLALGAIVTGHAISVFLAHARAERLHDSPRLTLRALLPLTVLMVLYTIISLQILAEPLVRYSGPQETII